jgi:hypothetical protein
MHPLVHPAAQVGALCADQLTNVMTAYVKGASICLSCILITLCSLRTLPIRDPYYLHTYIKYHLYQAYWPQEAPG